MSSSSFSDSSSSSTSANKIEGVLALVKNNQSTDSCRSYQCIKTLVNATNRSVVVKEYLLQDPKRWQWSVNWLRSKMTGYGYWSPNPGTSRDNVLSNEDPTTRTFHRTTSAQVSDLSCFEI